MNSNPWEIVLIRREQIYNQLIKQQVLVLKKINYNKKSFWKFFLSVITCGLYNPIIKLKKQLDDINQKLKDNEKQIHKMKQFSQKQSLVKFKKPTDKIESLNIVKINSMNLHQTSTSGYKPPSI